MVGLFGQRRLWGHLLEDFRGRARSQEEQETSKEPDQPDEPAQQRGGQEGKKWNKIFEAG